MIHNFKYFLLTVTRMCGHTCGLSFKLFGVGSTLPHGAHSGSISLPYWSRVLSLGQYWRY